MELDKLEQSVKRLRAAIDEFPIGAVSLDDFKPVEEKIQETRESLMRLNARSLMLRAKFKRMSLPSTPVSTRKSCSEICVLRYRVRRQRTRRERG